MSPVESVMLVRLVKAHWPQQPVDEYTADALLETCGAYALADLRTAVLAIAERGEHWCAPTDVKAEVKRIRTRRIQAAGDLVPPAGLTGPQERTWLAQARRRLGDGEPPADLGQLAPVRPRRDVRQLGQAGTAIHTEQPRSEDFRAQARAQIALAAHTTHPLTTRAPAPLRESHACPTHHIPLAAQERCSECVADQEAATA